MSNDTEQEIKKNDLQAIIEESNRHRRWEYSYKMAKIIITPIIITLVSMFVTYRINKQQAENTKLLTEIQIKSAQIIAEANREHSAKLSESQQKIERLNHIKDIFKNFLNDASLDAQQFQAQKMQIISLEVYKEDALLFLLNIREHYNSKLKQGKLDVEQKKRYLLLKDQADQSIKNILLNSQVNVSSHLFMECNASDTTSTHVSDDDPCISFETKIKNLDKRKNLRKAILKDRPQTQKASLVIDTDLPNDLKKLPLNEINLRQQEYKNFNFTNCSFIKANLYNSDFSSCTLNNNFFFGVDLQGAKFSGSNLSGSIFCDSNLKKADFKDSKLQEVVFVNPIKNRRDAYDNKQIKDFCDANTCCQLEGAKFSLGSLLKVEKPPFDIFFRGNKNEDGNKNVIEPIREEWRNLYINLLMYHHESIALMVTAAKVGDDNQKEKLQELVKNTNTHSAQNLIELLEDTAAKNKILATPDTSKKLSSLTLP